MTPVQSYGPLAPVFAHVVARLAAILGVEPSVMLKRHYGTVAGTRSTLIVPGHEPLYQLVLASAATIGKRQGFGIPGRRHPLTKFGDVPSTCGKRRQGTRRERLARANGTSPFRGHRCRATVHAGGFPVAADRAAMLVAVGGGYWRIEAGNEALPAAMALAACGITAYVLRYRLPATGRGLVGNRIFGHYHATEPAVLASAEVGIQSQLSLSKSKADRPNRDA